MADLLARFKLVDEMSDKLDSMAQSGQSMVDRWEQAGDAANAAFEGISGGVTTATSAVDGVATSIDSLQGAANSAASSADTMADSFSATGSAAEEATAQTDYWTDAVGNYSKSALEAVYSTEELVEMGYKTADALEEQEQMFELCEQQAKYLNSAIEASADIEKELTDAIEQSNTAISELADNENVSAEAKNELQRAAEQAAEAQKELTEAHERAEQAMQEYDRVMTSGTTDLEELEAAAEQACHAAEDLAEANGKASEATESLSKATEQATAEAEQAGKGAENAGDSGVEAINGVASALAAAGIVDTVKEISEAVYDLATEFSDAEKTVVNATGATGEALDGLEESMLKAYSSNDDSLADTAGAIGEINTRMGLTGEELAEVTQDFMDFADITGGNAVTSVQNLTKIMNKWGLEQDDLITLMDDLAYAGQISGASVESLSSTLITGASNFQNMGLSLENTISLLADFELAGISGTSAITAIRTAVNNFADDGVDAETGLQNVIKQIAEMGDTSEATALAVDTFGSRAGQELALAIQNGTLSVDSFNASMEEAEGTLERTAEAGESLDEKWEKAGNNIKTAFTTALQPTIDDASAGLAGLANNVGTFLNDHPKVTKAISAIATGLGVAAVGIAGVSAAFGVATVAATAFGTALSAAIWPITAVAAGVAAVSAAVLILKGNYDDAYDETMSMTAVTAQQTEKLESLQEEYEKACDTYGETSEEASSLRYQIDELSTSIEANGKSVEELVSECDALIDEHNSLMEEMDSNSQTIKDSELDNLALITRLEELATSTENTAGTQKEMEAVISGLNSSVDGLNLSYEDLIENQDSTIQSIKEMAAAQAEQQAQQEKYDEYVELLQQEAEEQEKLAEVTDEVTAAQERANTASHDLQESWKKNNGELSGWKMFWSWTSDEQAANDAAQEALDEVTASQEELQSALEETQARIAEIEDEWEGVGDAADDATEQTMTYEEAAATAYESVQSSIEELCAAYDEAYQAAYESFSGQFGLFDEASTSSEEYLNATVTNAQAALDSQLAYWESYNTNLETLTAYGEGLTGEARENYEALLEYAQSGNEEAAGLAASMAEAINSGNTEAVSQLSETMGQVTAAQEEVAATTADWQTNFTEQMNQYQQDMENTIADMDLSDEAKTAAMSTVQSYADSIRAGKSGAVAAAKEVANAVSAALASANTTVNVSTSTSVSGHANGTTNAESVFLAGENGPELVARPAAAYAGGTTDSADYFIAGENGPELIVGEQGSTVFPTEETDRLISALNSKDTGATLPTLSDSSSDEGSGRQSTKEQVKRILLEIAGSGAIEVGGSGADKETILEVLYDNLKPVLMNIIQGEIYEEGELSYEY